MIAVRGAVKAKNAPLLFSYLNRAALRLLLGA
jgi:hypothetical protein